MLSAANPGKTSKELIELLLGDGALVANADAKTALLGLQLLLRYVEWFGIGAKVVFEPSLARGLDYYTGAIYEAVITEFAYAPETKAPVAHRAPADQEEELEEETGVGSVAGGGRYDNLVGMFDAKGKNVPCCGVSIGIERIFSIMEMKMKVCSIQFCRCLHASTNRPRSRR